MVLKTAMTESPQMWTVPYAALSTVLRSTISTTNIKSISHRCETSPLAFNIKKAASKE